MRQYVRLPFLWGLWRTQISCLLWAHCYCCFVTERDRLLCARRCVVCVLSPELQYAGEICSRMNARTSRQCTRLFNSRSFSAVRRQASYILGKFWESKGIEAGT